MVARNYRLLAQQAARAAADKKGIGIVVLDVRQESDVADYMVIAGAESSAQMRAMNDNVRETLGELGVSPVHRDGHAHDRWLVLDYGGMVVHILLPEARDFYRLEQMWENPKHIHWETNGKAKPKKK